MEKIKKEIIKVVYFNNDISKDVKRIYALISWAEFVIDELSKLNFSGGKEILNRAIEDLRGYVKDKTNIITNLSEQTNIKLFTEGGDPIADMGIGFKSKTDFLTSIHVYVNAFFNVEYEVYTKKIKKAWDHNFAIHCVYSYFLDEEFIHPTLSEYFEDIKEMFDYIGVSTSFDAWEQIEVESVV